MAWRSGPFPWAHMASRKQRCIILLERSISGIKDSLPLLLILGEARKFTKRKTSLILYGSNFVQCGPGNEAARVFGMEEAPVSVKKSVDFVVATVKIFLLVEFEKKYVSNGYELQVDAATGDKTSGHFPSIEGEDRTW